MTKGKLSTIASWSVIHPPPLLRNCGTISSGLNGARLTKQRCRVAALATLGACHGGRVRHRRVGRTGMRETAHEIKNVSTIIRKIKKN